MRKGWGEAQNVPRKGDAMEMAVKSAVSDGRKRCLRVFGRGTGNSVYDKKYIRKRPASNNLKTPGVVTKGQKSQPGAIRQGQQVAQMKQANEKPAHVHIQVPKAKQVSNVPQNQIHPPRAKQVHAAQTRPHFNHNQPKNPPKQVPHIPSSQTSAGSTLNKQTVQQRALPHTKTVPSTAEEEEDEDSMYFAALNDVEKRLGIESESKDGDGDDVDYLKAVDAVEQQQQLLKNHQQTILVAPHK